MSTSDGHVIDMMFRSIIEHKRIMTMIIITVVFIQIKR